MTFEFCAWRYEFGGIKKIVHTGIPRIWEFDNHLGRL